MQNKKGKQDNNSPIIPFNTLKGHQGKGDEHKAFTLIELLVVITILAILATIWFLSFQSYNTFARNSVHLWNLKTIESWLWIQYVQSWNYALPDDSVNITASWTIIRKQWVFWKKALRTVWVSKNWSTDPLTQEYFDYSVWANLQEYQLVAYLEWDETMVSPHLASPKERGIIWNSYANIWKMKSMWQDLWIVFSWWLELHKTASNIWNDFDIRKAWDEYTVKFSEWDEITSSWSLLFSSIYNHSKNLLKNKELAKLDDSLVLYFDMETTTDNWKLKDLSSYGNDGTLIWWVKIGTEVWINWKATYFDWTNDYIKFWINWLPILDEKRTLFVISKAKSNCRVDAVCSIVFWWKNGHHKTFEFNDYWPTWSLQLGIWEDSYALRKHKLNYWDKLGFSYYWNWEWYFLDEWNFDKINLWTILETELTTYWWVWWWRHWYFNWTIDEVRIYNRALSEEEIKNVYGSTLK